MAKSFEAQVSAWVHKSQARMRAVFQEATQKVANEVRKPKRDGGHMPIDTANLRRSLLASTSSLPQVRPGVTFPDNDSQITLTIAGADIGDVIYLGFQADYARAQEYGTENISGNGFVRLTAQRWPEIVAQAAREVKAKVNK